METYLNLILIRFGVIAGAVVLVVLIVFAVALILRRQGKLSAARKAAAPVLRNYADARSQRMAATRSTALRPDWVGVAARTAASALERTNRNNNGRDESGRDH